MQVSGQLQAPAASPTGTDPTNPLGTRLIIWELNQFKCLSSYWCFGKDIIYGTCNAIY